MLVKRDSFAVRQTGYLGTTDWRDIHDGIVLFKYVDNCRGQRRRGRYRPDNTTGVQKNIHNLPCNIFQSFWENDGSVRSALMTTLPSPHPSCVLLVATVLCLEGTTMAKGTLRLQIWTFSPRSTIERYFPRWSLNSAIFADFMLI